MTTPDQQLPFQSDPSALSGNTSQQSPEDLYAQKVELLSGSLRTRLDEKVTASKNNMIRSAEGSGYGNSERINLYEAVRERQAADASQKVGASLHELRATRGQTQQDQGGDVFDKVAALVDLDRGDGIPGAGHDNTGFAAGRFTDSDLDELTYENRVNELSGSPDALAKAEKTIGMLVNHGVYKLARWGNSAQLTTALSLLNSYTRWVPEFSPDNAGFGDAAHGLIGLRAALQADQTTKPNYQYAKPERGNLVGVTNDGLNSLAQVQAHYLLRTHDVELPSTAAAG